MGAVTLHRIAAGAWSVHLDGERIGSVGGAKDLGGYDFQGQGGIHSVNPRRYPTRTEAAQELARLAAQAVA